MHASPVNVHIPIASQATFASSLAAQSRQAYARLVHSPLITENLPHGGLSAFEVEGICTTYMPSLTDMGHVLREVVCRMEPPDTVSAPCQGSVVFTPPRGSPIHKPGTRSPWLTHLKATGKPAESEGSGAGFSRSTNAPSPLPLPSTLRRAFHVPASWQAPKGAELDTTASEHGAYRSHAAAALPPPQQVSPSDTRRETESTIPGGPWVDGAGPYADLEGWLFLLVGVTHAIIYLLRDLSRLQASVAWSAWYWSWAQDHPRQATFHYALGSPSFWVSVVTKQRGLVTQVATVKYAASRHLLSLHSLFRLIVSCVGAAHGALERLNASLKVMEGELAVNQLPHRADTPKHNDRLLATTSGVLVRSMLLQHGCVGPEAFDVLSETSGRPAAPTHGEIVDDIRVVVTHTITTLTAMVAPTGLPMIVAQEVGEDLWMNEADPGGEIVGGVTGLTEAMQRGKRPTSPQLRLSDFQHARQATLHEGSLALLNCVERSRCFLNAMEEVIQRTHKPPAARHWRRVAVFALTTVPTAIWVKTMSIEQLVSLAQRSWRTSKQLFMSYVVVPVRQLREALFYVRPGVEERRTAFDRDAKALANIVRDYHQDYYPDAKQTQLDAVRDNCLDCLRRGVADDDGFGLIEKSYRRAVKHPIRGTVFGDLPRILLIQMSLQALEVSRVTNGLDEVLEGNDLNFKIMAIMPVVAASLMGGLWSILKLRSTMKPVRNRMKLFWRAVYRVVTMAEGEPTAGRPLLQGHSGVNGFPSFGSGPRFAPGGAALESSSSRTVMPLSLTLDELPPHCNSTVPPGSWTEESLVGDTGATPPPPSCADPRHRASISTQPPSIQVPLTDSSPDFVQPPLLVDNSEVRPRGPSYNHRPMESVRILNSYEQGLILLYVHLMRSTADEYFRSYTFYHELLEDLRDLESTKCTRHQRLEILQRMSNTHDFFR